MKTITITGVFGKNNNAHSKAILTTVPLKERKMQVLHFPSFLLNG
ncbi:hypothetical protein FHS11_001274 [Mucilaginibacter gotjawali]|uniref:Uncharacterized protein n=1 Tax=Mucilaginibacter gotjawali TaxID=1550579 RepID=A0A839SE98_9SPHI|nr:hypothetical protein [Mucilaginibacter gotjawali]MBB3054857.1 hypothetical protein [Mucilaginibacter gotjawali]